MGRKNEEIRIQDKPKSQSGSPTFWVGRVAGALLPCAGVETASPPPNHLTDPGDSNMVLYLLTRTSSFFFILSKQLKVSVSCVSKSHRFFLSISLLLFHFPILYFPQTEPKYFGPSQL